MLNARSILLTTLGAHVQGRDRAVGTASFVRLLEQLGVGERTTRSALNRMVASSLLSRHRVGRRSYFAPLPETIQLLRRDTPRIVERPTKRLEPDGPWTLLSFSLPTDRRVDRDALRRRLAWEGFGPLRDGLWLAPGKVDTRWIAGELHLVEHIAAFHAVTAAPTLMQEIVHDTWDVGELENGYQRFVERWSDPGLVDSLACLHREILLLDEWRHLIRDDPELPVGYLPDPWAGATAYTLFRRLYDGCRVPADAEFWGTADFIRLKAPRQPEGPSAVGEVEPRAAWSR